MNLRQTKPLVILFAALNVLTMLHSAVHSQISYSRFGPVGTWDDTQWFDNGNGMPVNGPPTLIDDVIVGDSISGDETAIFGTMDPNFVAEAASLSIGDDFNDVRADVFLERLHVDGDIFINNGSLNMVTTPGNGSSFNADNLSIGGMGDAQFFIGDGSDVELQQLAITGSGGNLDIMQIDDSTTGLTITGNISVVAGGLIDVDFDNATNGDSFDWALRVAGDERASLQALIDDGLLTFSGTSEAVNLVFDDSDPLLGDFTYLAVGSAAVPEPSSVLLSGLAASLILLRRKRC